MAANVARIARSKQDHQPPNPAGTTAEDLPVTALTTTNTREPCATGRQAQVTRSLLGYGLLVGPLYIAVGVTEGLLRDGFDFSRHGLSLLANGPWGWVHSLTLAIGGAMVIGAAVGLARTVRDGIGRRWLPRLVAGYGLGMVIGAVFRADPMDGFLGTPPGPPADPTLAGTLHMIGSSLGFLSAAIATFVLARRLHDQGRRREARWSLGAGVVAIAGMATATAVGVWAAVVVLFVWLATVSIRAYHSTTA